MIRIHTRQGDIDVNYERSSLPFGWWKYEIHECHNCVELGINYGMPSVFYSPISLSSFRLANNADLLEYMSRYTYETPNMGSRAEIGRDEDGPVTSNEESESENRETNTGPGRNFVPSVYGSRYTSADWRTRAAAQRPRFDIEGENIQPLPEGPAEERARYPETYPISLRSRTQQDQAGEDEEFAPTESPGFGSRRPRFWSRREPSPSGPSAETVEDSSEGLETLRTIGGILTGADGRIEAINDLQDLQSTVSDFSDLIGPNSEPREDPDIGESPEDSSRERPEVLIPRAQRDQTGNGTQGARNRERTGIRRPLP